MLMMTYEYSNQTQGNHIVVDLFKNLDGLKKSKTIDTIGFKKTLARANEGTPSFDNVDFNGKNL